MMKFLIFVFVAISGSLAVNYCDPQWQCASGPHVGCKAPASKCTSQVSLVPLNSTTQQFIVDFHNRQRNNLASGYLDYIEGGTTKYFAWASGMTEMVWDQELANLAAIHATSCDYKRDLCHNTETAPISGQNTASTGIEKSNPVTINEVLEPEMYGWMEERTWCTQSILDNYPASASNFYAFTTILHEKNNKVGCAVSTWDYTDPVIGNWDYFLIVCNYGYDSVVGQPIYTKGLSQSACKNGPSANYRYLCK